MNRLYAILFIFITLISFNCQKELNYVNQPGSPRDLSRPDPVMATVQGNILDEYNQPASGVVVKAGNKSTVTDGSGYFKIVNAGLDRNATMVSADKTGYFKAYRTFSATDAANNIEIKLARKELAGTIALNGGTVTLFNGTTIALPAGAVVKANGTTHTGDIKVYAAYIDPTRPDIAFTVPGSFMGDNAANERVLLESYGMLAVELESATGEKLQMAEGKQATLTAPIPGSLLSSAPATISLWYVNEQTGIWKEEGKAVRSANNYIGEVKHFTYWNFDVAIPGVLFKATLKNEAGSPLVNAHVKVRNASGGNVGYAYGSTDSTGRVTGMVAANQPLILEVYSSECDSSALNTIYTKNIGPFSQTTDIGVVTIPAFNSSMITIKGKIVNCSGAPAANGSATIAFGYKKYIVQTDQNGQFSITIIKCNYGFTQAIITPTDNESSQQGDPVSYEIGSGVNTGTISACGTSTSQYIRYTVDGNPYSFSGPGAGNLLDMRTWETADPIGYRTSASGINSTQSALVQISFFSSGMTPGTYAADVFGIPLYNTSNIVSPFLVTVSQFPQTSGAYYEGSFKGQFRDSLNMQTIHDLKGNFRMQKP